MMRPGVKTIAMGDTTIPDPDGFLDQVESSMQQFEAAQKDVKLVRRAEAAGIVLATEMPK